MLKQGQLRLAGGFRGFVREQHFFQLKLASASDVLHRDATLVQHSSDQ